MADSYRMAPERPEWVHCIARTHKDAEGFAWCGVWVGGLFSFVSLDHAAENGKLQGRLVACRECVDAAVAALKNGQDDPEYADTKTDSLSRPVR